MAPLGATAQSGADTPPPPGLEELEKLGEGLRKLFEGLADDMAPLLDGLAEQLEGLNAYEPPEVLPNGDIIIRRKKPGAPEEIEPNEDGSIDL